MNTNTIQKAKPLLPNSCPRILQPIPCKCGSLQVRWIEQLDDHGLFLTTTRRGNPVEVVIATHNNGYSCHALAERMLAGDIERVLDQAQYIADCGGLIRSLNAIVEYTLEVIGQ